MGGCEGAWEHGATRRAVELLLEQGKRVFAFLLVCPEVTAQKLLENQLNSKRGGEKKIKSQNEVLTPGS